MEIDHSKTVKVPELPKEMIIKIQKWEQAMNKIENNTIRMRLNLIKNVKDDIPDINTKQLF